MPHLEIYCPKCRYRPVAEDRWACQPGCGTSWNTFWTRGLCPECTKLWHVTQCPTCEKVSPHRNWYHAPNRVADQRKRQDKKVTTS